MPQTSVASSTQSNIKNNEINDVSIRFQKSIDSNNNVVLLEFAEQSYLVLMGKNNLLLDKFTDNKPVNQDDFENILKNRHQELDDFLRVQSHEQKEPLQAYKERAASLLYSNEA
jgi:wyosine [tRNA(Phe)-imidazoG37] synthetase (radical SAM superfamily)